jgi:hypothetical protein
VNSDHCECLRAEVDDFSPRVVLVVNSAFPGADAFAIASAAFASAAVALGALTERPAMVDLSQKCLQHAVTMYKHACKMQQNYCVSVPECAKTYKADCWQQFVFFAAVWLYRATGKEAYKKVLEISPCACVCLVMMAIGNTLPCKAQFCHADAVFLLPGLEKRWCLSCDFETVGAMDHLLVPVLEMLLCLMFLSRPHILFDVSDMHMANMATVRGPTILSANTECHG